MKPCCSVCGLSVRVVASSSLCVIVRRTVELAMSDVGSDVSFPLHMVSAQFCDFGLRTLASLRFFLSVRKCGSSVYVML